MEKIGFSEVGRGLLFIMCPCQADTAAGRKQETISVKQRTSGMLDDGEADGKHWRCRRMLERTGEIS